MEKTFAGADHRTYGIDELKQDDGSILYVPYELHFLGHDWGNDVSPLVKSPFEPQRDRWGRNRVAYWKVLTCLGKCCSRGAVRWDIRGNIHEDRWEVLDGRTFQK